jgi:hypothetical protein
MDQVHYVPFRNEGDKTGLWKIRGVKQVVYGQQKLSRHDLSVAVNEMIRQAGEEENEADQKAKPYMDFNRARRQWGD